MEVVEEGDRVVWEDLGRVVAQEWGVAQVQVVGHRQGGRVAWEDPEWAAHREAAEGRAQAREPGARVTVSGSTLRIPQS